MNNSQFIVYAWSHITCRFEILMICTVWCAASAGLGLLQFCNLNSYRSKFIVGFALFMGLSVPQYFNEYLATSGHGPVHTGSTWVSS